MIRKMAGLAVAVLALSLAVGAAQAAAPKYLFYPTKAALLKVEKSSRNVHRVFFGVNLAPGRCVAKGRAVDLEGDVGYRRIECSWNGGWRSFTYINATTGRTWMRVCDRIGGCSVFRQ